MGKGVSGENRVPRGWFEVFPEFVHAGFLMDGKDTGAVPASGVALVCCVEVNVGGAANRVPSGRLDVCPLFSHDGAGGAVIVNGSKGTGFVASGKFCLATPGAIRRPRGRSSEALGVSIFSEYPGKDVTLPGFAGDG
jgi:hypothetical protein